MLGAGVGMAPTAGPRDTTDERSLPVILLP